MVNDFSTYTRFTVFGFGWANWFSEVLDFQGIEELEIVAGGCLKAIWTADSDAARYNIYVRPDNSDIFHEEYILGRFPNPTAGFNYDGNPILFVKFRTEADGNTLLQDTKMILTTRKFTIFFMV